MNLRLRWIRPEDFLAHFSPLASIPVFSEKGITRAGYYYFEHLWSTTEWLFIALVCAKLRWLILIRSNKWGTCKVTCPCIPFPILSLLLATPICSLSLVSFSPSQHCLFSVSHLIYMYYLFTSFILCLFPRMEPKPAFILLLSSMLSLQKPC